VHHFITCPDIGVIGTIEQSGSNTKKPQALVNDVMASGGVIITTYEQMRIHSTVLSKPKWSYVVLDEGHKIRNPDAEVTSLVDLDQVETSRRHRF
jgi:DNA excision repair protein ERCC-6